MSTLMNGLLTGIAFGFLLQKGRVVRFDKQMGALRLMDMTILKFFFSAILTGMVGVAILHQLGIARPLILPTNIGANIIGGLTFGLGWSIIGYCPGTSLGALGEGRIDALWGILGMLLGAALFAEVYPAVQDSILTWGREGSIRLPEIFGLNDWIVIAIFIAGGLGLFVWLEKKGL
ncbi:MAG: YeeE/YedE family protein [Nitrospiraceae bacterium]|nr:MAG: YeeE/YedE family protein [Nitrospiraceae bacterium]